MIQELKNKLWKEGKSAGEFPKDFIVIPVLGATRIIEEFNSQQNKIDANNILRSKDGFSMAKTEKTGSADTRESLIVNGGSPVSNSQELQSSEVGK